MKEPRDLTNSEKEPDPGAVQSGQDTWQQLRRRFQSGWRRNVSIVAAVLIVGLCLYYLGRNIAPLLHDLSWLQDIRWHLALISLALFSLGNLTGGVLWHLLIKNMGQKCSLWGCVWANTTSVLAKYLPGSAWQMAGRVYLTTRLGADVQMLGSATLLDLVTKILTALLLAALLVPAGILEHTLGLAAWLIQVVALLSLAALVAIPLASRLPFVRQRSRLGRWLPLLSAKGYWLTCAAMLVVWAINSAAYALLVESFQSLSSAERLLAAASLPLSMTAGTLAPLAPAGLGVREAALAATLGSVLSPALASAAALASRLVMTISDLVALGLVALPRRPLTHHMPKITQKD